MCFAGIEAEIRGLPPQQSPKKTSEMDEVEPPTVRLPLTPEPGVLRLPSTSQSEAA